MSIATRLEPQNPAQYQWVFELIDAKRIAKAAQQQDQRRSQARKQASPPAREGDKNAGVAAQSPGGVSRHSELPSLEILGHRAYSQFRNALMKSHDEFALREITSTVERIRRIGVNVIAVRGYDELLQLIAGQDQGCFITRSSAGDIDIWLDADDCREISQILAIPKRAALESMLLHETGHLQATAILPRLGHPQGRTELLMAEHFAWAAAEQFHQSIGRCSRADFEAVRRYCLDSYLNS